MTLKHLLVLLTLGAMFTIIVGCVTTPTPTVKPSNSPAPLPNSSTSTPVPTGSAESTGIVAPIATAVPTEVAAPPDEEDCMAACHIPDPNESFAVGADPQPANHAGYKTCLNCHTTLIKPAMPADHVGRLDAACPLCHK